MHTMKYSNIEFEVNIPETQIACELESNVVDLPQRSVKEHIEYALDNPIGAGDISTVVKKGDKVAIIISDITRKWQAIPTYLPILVDRLNKCGIADEDIIVISACGTHRRQTDEEHKELLGEDLFKRLKIVDHQCEDKENLVYMGETSRKTPVWLNKYAIDADKIILTGGVVYHFLAGYGGGRKSLVPGIAGKETINTGKKVGKAVKDTVKIVDDNNIVSQTPERKYVWIVQTPQVFDTELIKRAYRLLEKEGESAVTDDAMVVETMLGESVKLYEGSYENIKITTPEDLKVAEAFVGK